MKKYWIIILIAILGCSPVLDHSTIKELASTVTKDDGIDRVEATLIAQDFIIRRSLYDRLISIEPYREIKKSIWYKNGTPKIYAVLPTDRTGVELKRSWTLFFKDKRHTILGLFSIVPFHVIVDADTGEVLNWGIKKLEFDKQDYTTIEIYE
ncbi:MAG: hypothetical protein KBD53_07140 [Candidatus Omnitrophica bacterium]|nr:hypothetical protein [Candidatus Omnitrophota bacterium]